MGRPEIIYATDANAARLLDMGRADFRELVNSGHLPKPRKIGEFERWDVDELRQIISGDLASSLEDVVW